MAFAVFVFRGFIMSGRTISSPHWPSKRPGRTISFPHWPGKQGTPPDPNQQKNRKPIWVFGP
ncbi:hypothetical protein GCM10007273_10400 [Jeotgalicoccus aerolatus]|nr:hypothetical protein GCM10007273_10400 [Jeotgalicoccus aerolatus]